MPASPRSAEVILAGRTELLEHPEVLASQSTFTRFPIAIPPKLDELLANWSADWFDARELDGRPTIS